MQKEMSQFFQICNKPYLLNKYKDNQVVYTFCKIVSDKFITFPKYEIQDLKFHGFPNDEYQESRWKQFPSVLEKILKEDTQKKVETIREFLESCHGDDSTRDSNNDVHEPEYLFYHRLFTKSKCIPFDRIYKVYPELKKDPTDTNFPTKAYKIPVGTIIDIEFKDGTLRFNDVQDSNIQLDFLRLPFRKSFTAKIVISPKWMKYDYNYYRNRNAKWQELRIQGIETKDIKIYILECSRGKDWLKTILEKVGIKALVLNPVTINNNGDMKDAMIECCKREFRALLVNKDIYVIKKTKAKTFSIDADIPSGSFPWDLANFNIHYSFVPERILFDE